MLPKENRLKKKKDFEKVFKEGQGFKEDFLFLKVVKNNLNLTDLAFWSEKIFPPKQPCEINSKEIERNNKIKNAKI